MTSVSGSTIQVTYGVNYSSKAQFSPLRLLSIRQQRLREPSPCMYVFLLRLASKCRFKWMQVVKSQLGRK